MKPEWTILIATIGQRGSKLAGLLRNGEDGLLDQAEAANEKAGRTRVTISALWNNGERHLGRVRQDLIEHASSDFTSFVDDDDNVSPDFVEKVLSVLSDKIDYVGWRMQCIQDGRYLLPTYHSLRYWAWTSNDSGHYRDISHLNPIRRKVALHYASFCRRVSDPSGAEDADWSAQLRGYLEEEREAYIRDCMYFYHASSDDSTWRGVTTPPAGTWTRPHIESPYFEWHPFSSPESPAEVPAYEKRMAAEQERLKAPA